MPTQMGRIALPLTSFRTTIGMLVTGSIINPRIFISTSMRCSPFVSVYTLAHQRVRAGAGDAHVYVTAQNIVGRSGAEKIQRLVPGGPADPLACGFIEAFDQALLDRPEIFGVAAGLNFALQLLHDDQA